MNLVAAVDENWGIGYRGRLLVSIPKDMKLFQEMTMGKVVVMGRRTLESLPGGIPLAGRTNLVLSTRTDYQVRNAAVAHSVEEAQRELQKYRDEDIYVIGGERIYREFLPLCTVAHITKINEKFEADAYFPNLDEDKDWMITADSEEQTYFDLEYRFLKYERRRLS
ncbi:MAG: dihydrofolate reductase [Clostridiales bacterium]|nr:dihydrofolate reductase [Clostridiales bacterium]